jgi:hypothetical protein
MKRSESAVGRPTIEKFLALSGMRSLMRFGRGGRFSLSAGLVLVLMSSLSLGQTNSILKGVAAITPSDAWAVGNTNTVDSRGDILAAPLAEHWDGTKWTVISTPDPGGRCNTLSAVAALTSNDVWAVGGPYLQAGNCGSGSNFPAFIEHWDGTVWKIVPSPRPANKGLTGVAAIASNDVWAVGYSEPTSYDYYTLTEHWDGSQWKIVPSPNPQSQQTYFNAVAAVATNDVWAVGGYMEPIIDASAPFAEHWDGTTWIIVPVPDTSLALYGASSAGASEIWATGQIDFAVRWDGSHWDSSPIANTGGGLPGVCALPNGQVWTVGYRAPRGGVISTLTELWDGKTWNLVPSPNPSSTSNGFGGVSATGPDDVWAVGYIGRGTLGSGTNTLVEHWNGTAWSVVPSP